MRWCTAFRKRRLEPTWSKFTFYSVNLPSRLPRQPGHGSGRLTTEASGGGTGRPIRAVSAPRSGGVGEAGGGKYGCGCECERCKWRVAHLAELNNDIMRAPETAYIFAAFLAAQPLPKNCAVTEHDIPQTKALVRVAAASTTQEERFLRYLAMQQPRKPVLGTSEYTREEMWREFDGIWERDENRNQRKKNVGWRQQYEPHTVHIKSEDDLGQRMGKLIGSLAHEAPGALSKRRDKKRDNVRVWVLHHAKLRDYFEQHDHDDSSDEDPASGSGEAFPGDWGNLEAVARDFVRKHLAEASREEAPTAESGV